MAEKKLEISTNSNKSLMDSDTSDDSDINPGLKMMVQKGIGYCSVISYHNAYHTYTLNNTGQSHSRAWATAQEN